ncbi:MAG: GGDEF domain-containing protein [Pseudomonadota bacterium]
MSLQLRFTLLTVTLVLSATLAVWLVFDRLATGVVEQWGTRVAEVQVRYDSARLLQPLEREIALARQMADSPEILDLGRNPDSAAHERRALEAMERFRQNFSAGNYFVALQANGAYYFNNAENEFAGRQHRYDLSRDDPDDAWFYRLIEQGREFHLNVNPDTELGVTKLWIDVLMREPDTGGILGVVGTGLELEAALAETVAVDQPGITTIFVDQGGAIQLYRDRGLIDYASLVKPEGQKSRIDRVVNDPDEREQVNELLGRARQSAGEVVTGFVSMDGKRHLMGVAWLPRIGWHEVTLLDLDVIMPVSRFAPLLAVISILVLVSIALLHLALQHLLLRPIAELERAMQSVKEGRFERRQLPRASGEMRWLVSHFGDMAEAIVTHTRDLERKVEERTQELRRLARVDPLTDLLNRRGMQSVLEKTLARASREDRPLALIWIDIDQFKEINDTEGHDAGDIVLRQVADCLRAVLRDYDEAARWGGDEFLVVLYPSSGDHLATIAERLRRDVEEGKGGGGRSVTISVGGYLATGDEPLSRILARADRAVYLAKDAGRNRVCLYSGD